MRYLPGNVSNAESERQRQPGQLANRVRCTTPLPSMRPRYRPRRACQTDRRGTRVGWRRRSRSRAPPGAPLRSLGSHLDSSRLPTAHERYADTTTERPLTSFVNWSTTVDETLLWQIFATSRSLRPHSSVFVARKMHAAATSSKRGNGHVQFPNASRKVTKKNTDLAVIVLHRVPHVEPVEPGCSGEQRRGRPTNGPRSFSARLTRRKGGLTVGARSPGGRGTRRRGRGRRAPCRAGSSSSSRTASSGAWLQGTAIGASPQRCRA